MKGNNIIPFFAWPLSLFEELSVCHQAHYTFMVDVIIISCCHVANSDFLKSNFKRSNFERSTCTQLYLSSLLDPDQETSK